MPNQTNEYVSRDEESEAERIAAMQGVGEVHYLDVDQIKQYSLQDYGMMGVTIDDVSR